MQFNYIGNASQASASGLFIPVIDPSDGQPYDQIQRSNAAEITPAVVRGKHLWETRNCIGCHTLLGEGAYFAPELGNVYTRRGPDFIKAWIKSQPTGAPGRRQMPNFHFTDTQLDDLVEFLKWTNGVNTEKWPPNIEG